MSLDDEQVPWPAAEALERGENPERPDTAQFKLASLLAEHQDILTVHAYMLVAGRVLAFLPRIVSWADAEAKPSRAPQLRRQQVGAADDETFFLEQAHYYLSGYWDAMAALSRMGSVYAADYDPDARGELEDDARLSRERADVEAAAGAPRVAS